MPSKTSKQKSAAALPSIPKELIDQMVSGSMAFKKALIERILGAGKNGYVHSDVGMPASPLKTQDMSLVGKLVH